jgi:hypothetical protein
MACGSVAVIPKLEPHCFGRLAAQLRDDLDIDEVCRRPEATASLRIDDLHARVDAGGVSETKVACQLRSGSTDFNANV